MKELIIKVQNIPDSNYAVLVDGEEVPLSFDAAAGAKAHRITTEKDEVEIAVCRYNEMNGVLWLIMSLLFFFISVFGIFDSRYDRKAVQCNCRFSIKLGEGSTTVGLKLLKPVKQKRTFTGPVAEMYECVNGAYAVLGNNYFRDKVARRRYLIAFFIKLALFITAVIMFGVFGIPAIINAV